MKMGNRNSNIKKIELMVVMVLIASSLSLIAYSIPNSLTLQGKLTNLAGTSQQGNFNFTFAIYDNITAGNKLWEIVNTTLTTDANGVYDVILTNINLSFADQYYLGITVVSDNESSPRINLTSAPYSFRANTSESLNPNASYFVTNLSVSGNATFAGILAANNVTVVSLELGWSNLTNYPNACTSGQFVTTINDTITCDTPAPASGGGWTDVCGAGWT